MPRIGIQMVNVKRFLTTKEDMTYMLEKIKGIGYNLVQLSGVSTDILNYELMCHFGSECERLNIEIGAVHVNFDIVAKEFDYVTDLVKNVFKSKYVGVAGPDQYVRDFPSAAVYEDYGKRMNAAAKVYKERGLTFTYHNHEWEYSKLDGEVMFEVMYKYSPDVNWLIDTHWLHRGGYDMFEFMERMKGQFDIIHIKDYLAVLPFINKRLDLRNVPIGDGVFNFERIIKCAVDNGCKYLYVEQDDFYGEDELVCAQKSYDELVRLGYKDWF